MALQAQSELDSIRLISYRFSPRKELNECSDAVMMMIVFGLILLASYLPPAEAVECFQCTGDYGGTRCTESCTGELCVVWKWKTKSELLFKQGCLSGLDRRFTAKIGCRTNHLGASLCVCDDGDLCNRVERTDNTLRPLPVVRLPSVECSKRVTGTGIFGSKREHFCNANYCHMMKTETYSLGSSAPDFLNVYNCADVPEFDFDVRLKNTAGFAGLYANGCYRIQTQPREIVTDCTCSKNNCNSGLPVVISGPVRCYMAQGVSNDTEVDNKHFCDGDYCFIQRTDDKYTKGCLSVNERNSWSHIISGHRHLAGIDQWLCQSHLCNLDMVRMYRAIAPPPHVISQKSNGGNVANTILVVTLAMASLRII